MIFCLGLDNYDDDNLGDADGGCDTDGGSLTGRKKWELKEGEVSLLLLLKFLDNVWREWNLFKVIIYLLI